MAAAWSRSENDRFEHALATHDLDAAGSWDRVAAAVGGGKTADDVKRHYDRLLQDLRRIEAEANPPAPTGDGNNNDGPAANGNN